MWADLEQLLKRPLSNILLINNFKKRQDLPKKISIIFLETLIGMDLEKSILKIVSSFQRMISLQK